MTRFQAFGALLILALLGLVALGGAVRVTDSGLACPDWPFCYGSIIPPVDEYRAAGFEAHQVWLEWSHRLAAALIGLAVLAYAIIAWLRHRDRRWIVLPALASIPMLALQGGLGALTVTERLEPVVVTAHLAAAMAILMLVSASWLGSFRPPAGDPEGGAGVLARWSLAAAVLVYLAVVVGSYVTHADAAYYCGNQWPLCNGQLWPDGRLPQWQMTHRLLAAVATAAVLAVGAMAVQLNPRSRSVVLAAHGAAALVVLQILLGAATMWTNLDDAIRVLHLAFGAAAWTAAVAAAVLAAQRAGWISFAPIARTAPRAAGGVPGAGS